MSEFWKDIEGYKGIYKISNLGRVKTLERTVLFGHTKRLLKEGVRTPVKSKEGYWVITLSNKRKKKLFSIHRLVATHFIPNPNNYPEVNHINGDKEDNDSRNLEWCTRRQNIEHAHTTGLTKQNGVDSHWAKLTNEQVISIRSIYKNEEKVTYKDLAKKFEVSEGIIGRVVRRESYKMTEEIERITEEMAR